MHKFYPLTITKIIRLTPNAVAISFAIPESLIDTFSFSAGQYITIKHKIDGKEVRRAYSISSSPMTEEITIGIKKVEGGLFSVYANADLQVGDTLEVMPPEGRFIFSPSTTAVRIGAFAAGSGITPILSIAKTVLSSNLENEFVLIYGNKTPEEVMFLEDIKALIEKYSSRFFIKNIYSRSQEPDALFGRIEASTVNFIVKNRFKEVLFDAFYLCGPEAMITGVTETLTSQDIAKEKIHFELFTTSETSSDATDNLDGKTQLQVQVDDEAFSFTMDQKTLILDAVLKEDIDAPYSCQGGVCSSCIARIVEGEATMVNNQILTDSEIAEGLILTCQAHPLTPTLKIDYDDV